jgi:hypothetical protein
MMSVRDYRLHEMSPLEVDGVWRQVRELFGRHFELPAEYNVLRSQADRTFGRWLRVVECGGQPVGAVLVRGFRSTIQERDTVVFRAAACVDNEFRQRSVAVRFVARVVISHWFKHPLSHIYYVDPVIHPSSFLAIHRHVAQVYPNLNDHAPACIQAVFRDLKRDVLSAYDFAFANPYVCRIPFNTIESSEFAATWARRALTDRHVMRFVSSGAAERDRGLLCIVPIDAWNVLLSVPLIFCKVAWRLLTRGQTTSSPEHVDSKRTPA